jgi:hypothetical protein
LQIKGDFKQSLYIVCNILKQSRKRRSNDLASDELLQSSSKQPQRRSLFPNSLLHTNQRTYMLSFHQIRSSRSQFSIVCCKLPVLLLWTNLQRTPCDTVLMTGRNPLDRSCNNLPVNVVLWTVNHFNLGYFGTFIGNTPSKPFLIWHLGLKITVGHILIASFTKIK